MCSKLLEAVHFIYQLQRAGLYFTWNHTGGMKSLDLCVNYGGNEQSALENNRTFNNKATASACFTFE